MRSTFLRLLNCYLIKMRTLSYLESKLIEAGWAMSNGKWYSGTKFSLRSLKQAAPLAGVNTVEV